MKLVFFILLVPLLHVSANTYSQSINLKAKNITLKTAFNTIKEQTGYTVFATDFDISKPVIDLNLKNASLQQAIVACIKSLPLDYQIVEKTVVLTRKVAKSMESNRQNIKAVQLINVRGKVVDEEERPLPGANIKLKSGKALTRKDSNGQFYLTDIADTTMLVISFMGYKSIAVQAAVNLGNLKLTTDVGNLDEVIIGYGKTSVRNNTGTVSTLRAVDIEKQPVTNILSALSGRLAGVFVQTTNGLPGGNVNLQIRGKGSLTAGTNPLYIIDGVPFDSGYIGTVSSLQVGTVIGPVSTFNSLNPSDIESITILKDADATAIYGSRGTNGVVLITTKKGKAGDTQVDLKLSEGFSQAASLPQMLTIDQQLDIRREGFANSGIVPSSDPTSLAYAPDLTLWDQKQNTNWSDYMLGGTAFQTDAQAAISGGSEFTSFRVGGSYHQESSILAGDNWYKRGGILLSLQHRSKNSKFNLMVNAILNKDDNSTSNPANYISNAIALPPNYPLYNANGTYNWYISNPEAELNGRNRIKTDNILANFVLSYQVTPDLELKTSLGYNKMNTAQMQLFPKIALFPGRTNYSQLGQNMNSYYIMEPQLNYRKTFDKHALSVLIGGTTQRKSSDSQFIKASNFMNESLMLNLAAAGTYEMPSNTMNDYKFVSIFSRITYTLADKYILNLTMRRDGSSKFGPDNRFGNFGSIGATWLFDREEWVKNHLPWLSLGKIRASYGVTGNDQISDYQYLSTYGSSTLRYQDNATISPQRIANTNFRWEYTHKMELATELGFINDLILLNVNFFRNRSSDQLISYTLPRITGFTSYQANLPAVVENKGWEIELTTKNLESKNFSWSSSFNITVPKNKLISFQNFETSSYAQTYEIGYDVSRIVGYQFLGIDSQTGMAKYAAQDGTVSATPYFNHTLGKTTPDFYGGVNNAFRYKSLSLDIFVQYARQMARGGLCCLPGNRLNNYALVLDRWQQPGDITTIPKASFLSSDPYYLNSSANLFDASYLRVKNIAVNWAIADSWIKKVGLKKASLGLQGQNIFSFWHKDNPFFDPESGAFTSSQKNITPLKTYSLNLQISF
jgi:TonB-linked SusC/RagA family outer membrane protein